MKYFLAAATVLQFAFSFAQHSSDSVQYLLNSWQFAPRFGISAQRNAFVEAGISLHRYKTFYERYGRHSLFGSTLAGFYASSELMIRFDKTIVGPKIGLEFATFTPASPLTMGIELTHYTDFREYTNVLTPRIGICLVIAELTYGYNFFVGDYFAGSVGRHRVALTMNLNPRYWQKKAEMTQEYRKYMEQFRGR